MMASFGGSIAYDAGYFLLRAVFIHVLSAEYLGLEGLFSSILSVLSLMELGISPAFSVSLYKPVAENDKDKIKSLIQFYRKVYYGMATAVIFLGICIAPFVTVLIKDIPEDIQHIQLIFILFVLNSALSYIGVYKQSIFVAHQKNYLVLMWYNSARLLMMIVQGIFLVLTRNYIVYLFIQSITTVCVNQYISWQANRKYEYLKEKAVQKLDADSRKEIKKNTIAAGILGIGSVLVNSTDQMIISGFIGLTAGGIYSNYALVSGALSSLESKGFNAMIASVGNLAVVASSERFTEVFYRILFAGMWISSFCTIGLYCTLQDLMILWLGKDYLLGPEFVLCLSATFYFYSLRLPAQIFNSATGSYRYMKNRAFAEGVINLVVSIALVGVIGVTGVKLGTLISCLCVPFWIEPYILYQHKLNTSMKRYWRWVLQNMILMLAACMLTNWVCSFVHLPVLPQFVVKAGICCIIPNAIFAVCFWKQEEFKYFRGLLRSKLHR